MTMKEQNKVVYAGMVNFEGKDFDAFINVKRDVLIKSRAEENGFKSIGTFTEYLDKVEDMFGTVSLWRVYGDNFKK